MRLLVPAVVLFTISVAESTALAQQPAKPTDCSQALPEPITYITFPEGDQPLSGIATNDGCWIFVAVNRRWVKTEGPPRTWGTGIGLAVFRRGNGHVEQVRYVPVQDGGTDASMKITADGKVLVAFGFAMRFLDIPKLIAGDSDPFLGQRPDSTTPPVGGGYGVLSPDDKHLFVVDGNKGTIAVLDLPKARQVGFSSEALIGRIPIAEPGLRSVAHLMFSPDGRYLYANVADMSPNSGGRLECTDPFGPTAKGAPDRPQGLVRVIDVARAITNPAASVIASARAGCWPTRVEISPSGDVLYADAQGDGMLLAFDTRKLIKGDTANVLIGRAPVGRIPAGVIVIDGGRKVVTANRNDSSLTVIDANKMSTGAAAVLGSIAVGPDPRNLAVTADGRTLLVANSRGRTFELIDLTRLSLILRPSAQ